MGDLGGKHITPPAGPTTIGSICTLGHYYLVTIKCVSIKYTSRKDIDLVYTDVIKKLSRYQGDWSDNVGYELDCLNRLHLHTYVVFNKTPWFKGVTKKNWTIHFQSFPKSDVDNVIRYIKKESQHGDAVQQREVESYYYNNPLDCFID